MEISKEKQAALKLALKTINKDGVTRIGKLSEMRPMNIPVIKTGSLALDMALGVGGWARGRIGEIFGPPSSGKTTMCFHAVGNVQAEGGVAAFIDMEHAVDLSYAKKCTVNVEDLLFSQPDNGDEAMEICDTLARSGAVDLIIVDSVAALVTREELEKDITDNNIALTARLMSQALRRLSPACSATGTTIIFTNQIRYKPMVMYGSPETTPGGESLKFYAAQRLDIRRIGIMKVGNKVIGNETRVKVIKNKVAAPFCEALFNIMYDVGIDSDADVIRMAVEQGVILRGGAWYTYGEAKLHGLPNVIDFFKENKDLLDEIREKTLATIGVGTEETKNEDAD
jgi:recombination protein RecA